MNQKTEKRGIQKYFPQSWASQWIIFQIFFIGGYILIILNFKISRLSSEICDVVTFFVAEMIITAYGLKTLKEMKE